MRNLLKCLIILVASLMWSLTYAANLVGEYGHLIGQCKAMYDLGLIQDRESKEYVEKIIYAWNASNKRTANEFYVQYSKTKNMLQERRKHFGEQEAISFAKRMYPSYIAALSSSSGIKDINNSGQKILQAEQKKYNDETEKYYSRKFVDDELNRNYGWYIQLIKCNNGYTFETVSESYKKEKEIHRHPIRLCEINGDYGLWLGPFPTVEDAKEYYTENQNDFTRFSIESQFYRHDKGRVIEWSNKIKYSKVKQTNSAPGNINKNTSKEDVLKQIINLHPEMFSQLGILHAFSQAGLINNNTQIENEVNSFSDQLLSSKDVTGAFVNFKKLRAITFNEINSKKVSSSNSDLETWANDRILKAGTAYEEISKSRNELIVKYNAFPK